MSLTLITSKNTNIENLVSFTNKLFMDSLAALCVSLAVCSFSPQLSSCGTSTARDHTLQSAEVEEGLMWTGFYLAVIQGLSGKPSLMPCLDTVLIFPVPVQCPSLLQTHEIAIAAIYKHAHLTFTWCFLNLFMWFISEHSEHIWTAFLKREAYLFQEEFIITIMTYFQNWRHY